MKKTSYILFLSLILFLGCKSNPEAYSTTYRNLKEKEQTLDAKAKTALGVPIISTTRDSTGNYQSEKFSLILGAIQNISDYNIVSKSYINKTNARAYYTRMLENAYPAALIQNEEMMFRIIIASFTSKEDAEYKLKEIGKLYPDAFILKRIQ